MIVPCIDLMDGKVVQLVQGREKALEGDSPEEMLRKFAAFPEIQVIDLDAALGRGSNDDLVRMLAAKAVCRVGGGVRIGGSRANLARAGRPPRDRRHQRVHQKRHQRGTSRRPARCRGPRALDHRARFQRRPHRGQRLAGRHQLHRRRSARVARTLLRGLPLHLCR